MRERPQVTRNAFQRVYDMILPLRRRGVHRQQEEARSATTSSRDPIDDGKDAIFGLDIPLMRLCTCCKAAAAGLRPREARHPAARPGRLVEVDDRAPAQEGPRGLLAHARRRALHLRLGEPRRTPAWSAAPRRDAFPSPDARGAAAPDPARVARHARSRELGLSATTSTACSVDGDLDPACRFIFQRPDAAATAATGAR